MLFPNFGNSPHFQKTYWLSSFCGLVLHSVVETWTGLLECDAVLLGQRIRRFESSWCPLFERISWSWRRRQYHPSKRREAPAQLNGVTPQKTLVASSTALRPPCLATRTLQYLSAGTSGPSSSLAQVERLCGIAIDAHQPLKPETRLRNFDILFRSKSFTVRPSQPPLFI